MQRGHSERLMPMIEMVMVEAGLKFKSLDRIAVTFGPGTFTGTRICVSAARARLLSRQVLNSSRFRASSLWR
ncbi:hypothetical protein [Bradyrhizobium sp. RDI18]|uniref:hypothetical protein n=1 Tax=Bradyrhizobium sp. RDI18 TaxID=3367400 RepID=UPI00371C28F6